MSAYKSSSLMLTHQTFSEVILMFITRETDAMLNQQVSDIDIKNCPKCTDLLDSFVTTPAVIALRISCRALSYQVEA